VCANHDLAFVVDAREVGDTLLEHSFQSIEKRNGRRDCGTEDPGAAEASLEQPALDNSAKQT